MHNKVIYINKDVQNTYVELDEALDSESNYVGELGSFDDFLKGAWVEITDEQYSFHQLNLEANVKEVLDMELMPAIDPIILSKQNKTRQIANYDSSEAVNSFFVNGMLAWLTPEVRANYKNSIESAELLGETEITFIIANIPATSTLTDARLMLAKIQRYADKCTIVTGIHNAKVPALTTVEAVDAYDYTIGYPVKEEFTLTNLIQFL